jgi:glycosyltransferase involved in cell wall biosynthesis
MQPDNALSTTEVKSRIFEGNNASCVDDLSPISDKEEEKTSLSIMILTMNRKKEVLKTLQSCIECALPEKVEFVIVDNASQDGTKEAVDCFFKSNLFHYQYHYLSENVGSAGGRNEGFRRAKGRYVYFIEDDAYIDGPKQFFFEKMLNCLKENEDVFCVATPIFDVGLNGTRSVIASKDFYVSKYRKVFMFHGGSFLIDRQRAFDQENLFLGHQVKGVPELYPSLRHYFNNRYIVYMDDINIIHDPGENTRYYTKKNIIRHYVHATQVKLIFYPLVVYPFVYFFFFLRIIKHLSFGALGETLQQFSLTFRNSQKETTSFRLFLKMVKEFGVVPTL